MPSRAFGRPASRRCRLTSKRHWPAVPRALGTGQAYLNYRWKMFSYLIGVFATIKRLPIEDRQLAVASLDGFRRAISEVDTQSVWTQEFALQHLLFPDVAPSILSRNDRAS